MIPTLIMALTALGALLLVLLGLRVRAVPEDATLKWHRSKDAGLADCSTTLPRSMMASSLARTARSLPPGSTKVTIRPAALTRGKKPYRSASTRRLPAYASSD